MIIRSPETFKGKVRVGLEKVLGIRAKYALVCVFSYLCKPGFIIKQWTSAEKCKKDSIEKGILEPKRAEVWCRLYKRMFLESNRSARQNVPAYFFKSNIKKIYCGEMVEGILNDVDEPIVICALRNEIERLAIIMDYYRNVLHVKCFAMIDNGSSDGSREYLMKQEDTIVYHASEKYNSMQRSAWVCRVMEDLGLNRWYLAIDADECFAYPDYERCDLKTYTMRLRQKSIYVVKSLLLELYPKHDLFVEEGENFIKDYVWFDPDGDDYIYDRDSHVIYGGLHKRVFGSNWTLRNTFKLICPDEKRFVISAHEMYPFYEGAAAVYGAIVLHYKFLPHDMEKIKSIIADGNYANGSAMYKTYYKTFTVDGVKNFWNEKSQLWEGTKSFKYFEFINNLMD